MNKQKEIWKNIPGYEGYYQASDQGRIKSLARKIKRYDTRHQKFINRHIKERILKKGKGKCDYITVILCKKGIRETKKVGYLILLTFISPRPKGKEISHLNGNSLDDKLYNLKWETKKENEYRKKEHGTLPNFKGEQHPRAKLKNKDILEIRKMLNDSYTQQYIANKFKVHHTHISEIKLNKSWKHIQLKE